VRWKTITNLIWLLLHNVFKVSVHHDRNACEKQKNEVYLLLFFLVAVETRFQSKDPITSRKRDVV